MRSFEEEINQELPNPHNYGEYTFAPWLMKIAGSNVRVLSPNGQLKLGIKFEDDGNVIMWGDLYRDAICEEAVEEDKLVLKSVTSVCEGILRQTGS